MSPVTTHTHTHILKHIRLLSEMTSGSHQVVIGDAKCLMVFKLPFLLYHYILIIWTAWKLGTQTGDSLITMLATANETTAVICCHQQKFGKCCYM